MAIYTGGMRMEDEAKFASKRIAKQQAKAQKAEAKRKGRAGIFGTLGGMAMGALAVGAMGLTGGLAAPLVMGAASSLGKKWADEASQKGIFKTPGQVDKITAGGKYGYGAGEAAEATKALKESRKSTWSPESMLGDIAGSYVTAGLSGGLKGGADILKKGGEGSILDALGGAEGAKGLFTDEGLSLASGWEGVKQSFGYELGGLGEGGKGEFSVGAPEEIIKQPFVESPMDFSSGYEDYLSEGSSEEIFAQGGQVMDQNTLIGLAILSQMQQQQETAYSGTALEETKKPSSIADHFASQGKTLGGNNTQSLSQMLGR